MLWHCLGNGDATMSDHYPKTNRPCDHPTGPPSPDTCKVCYRYVHDPKYRALYDGSPIPGVTRKEYARSKTQTPRYPLPAPPKKTMLECVHLGSPTGETRVVQKGEG